MLCRAGAEAEAGARGEGGAKASAEEQVMLSALWRCLPSPPLSSFLLFSPSLNKMALNRLSQSCFACS